MTRYCIVIALLFVSLCSFGQARKLIRKGNKEFDKGNYSQAALTFRQAQAADPTSGDIPYNIGNSLYMQKNYKGAFQIYNKSLKQTKDYSKLAMLLHNQGNTLYKLGKYEESILAYKNSLKLNPSDNQTRYNLALAQQKIKKNNQQQKQDKNNKNQNKKQNQKNPQNNKQDKKDNKQQQKQQQSQQPKISKQDAQRMLDALQNSESKAQERVKAQKARSQSRKPEKNW